MISAKPRLEGVTTSTTLKLSTAIQASIWKEWIYVPNASVPSLKISPYTLLNAKHAATSSKKTGYGVHGAGGKSEKATMLMNLNKGGIYGKK